MHLVSLPSSPLSKGPTKALNLQNEKPALAFTWKFKLKWLTRRNWRILETPKKACRPAEPSTQPASWMIQKIFFYLSKAVTLKCQSDWRGSCLDSTLASLLSTPKKESRPSLAWCRFPLNKSRTCLCPNFTAFYWVRSTPLNIKARCRAATEWQYTWRRSSTKST